MRRKVLAWLLTLSMVFTMMPSLAFANTVDASVSETPMTVAETTSDDTGIDTEAELKAAIEAGGTVELAGDIQLTDMITIPADKTVVLDLNGKTISQTKAQDTGYQMILNDGNLTIKDSGNGGKISYTDSGNGGEYISDTIYNRAVLTIEGGTIENLSSATVASNGYPHAVDTYSGIRDTSVTINGGTIYCAEYSAIRMFCVSAANNADLTINGGTIKGAIDMQNGSKDAAKGSLTINNGNFETTKNANNIRFANWNGGATEYGIEAAIAGGTFNGGITTQYVPAAANWDSQIISGGTFTNTEVKETVSSMLAPGATLGENGNVNKWNEETISNLAELEAFRDMVNAGNTFAGKTVKLTADIDLTGKVWTPIGTSVYDKTPTTEGVKLFAGNFDGQGHTITGLSSDGYVPNAAETGSTEYSFGLFGYVYGGNISNVKLADVNIDCGTRQDSKGKNVGGSGVAALVGYYVPVNGKESVIENCHVLSGTVEASNNMGGLIGFFDSQKSLPTVDVTVKNCSNAANVTAEAREAGGILGLINGSREPDNIYVVMRGTITFEDCVNTGDVTALDGGGSTCAGGILGRDNAAFTGQRLKLIFDNCKNTGTITVHTSGETHVAGLGTAFYSHGSWLVVKDCVNEGTVVATKASNELYDGGLIAYAGVADIEGSTSTGDVTVAGEAGNKYVGDIQHILFLNQEVVTKAITGNTYYLNGGRSPEYAALVDDAAGGGNFHLVETAHKGDEKFGGWYDNPEFTGEAYTALDKNVKTYYAKWEYVAYVGDTPYTDLQEAVNAAAVNGGVVDLSMNTVLRDTVTIPVGKTVTLNLNGYNITGIPTETAAYEVIKNNGELTITGKGKIVCNHELAGSTAYAVNTITNCGTLTIGEGVTIKNKSTADSQIGYAIDNNSTSYDAILVIDGGKVTASGSNYYDGIRLFCNNETKENRVTVKAGEVSSIWLQNPSDGEVDKNTKDVKGSVAISGGTVNYLYLEPSTEFSVAITDGFIEKVSAFENADGRMPTHFITGGTFATEPEDVFLAEGFKANYENSEYVVKPIPYVAQVGDEKFETLQDAIESIDVANVGATVKVIDDITLAESVKIDKDIILDLNGKNITMAEAGDNEYIDAFVVTADVTVTGNGTVDARNGNGYAFYIGSKLGATGNVIIENGSFYGDSSVAQVTKGKLVIKGGYFEATEYDGAHEFTINCLDRTYKNGKAVVEISGGEFYKFNPANNAAEGANTSFTAAGYVGEAAGDVYIVKRGLAGKGTAAEPYLINNIEELKLFRDKVNDGNTYSGKFVKVTADIDLANEEWTPIGTDAGFKGTFDGDNHTISNLVITGYKSTVGLFANTYDGEIKNLTVENAKVSGRLNVGVVAGNPYTTKYTNIKLIGHVEVNGMSYVGGVGGKNAYADWTDITVDVDDTSYVKAVSTENGAAYRTYVGGVVGFMGEGGHTMKNITSNISVIGDVCDVGGIVGIAHYGNNFENVVCSGTVTNTNENAADATETGGIAGVWHNKVGYTVTFTNCDFTGTVDAKDVAPDTMVGAPYTPTDSTEETSGKLMINGEQVWPVIEYVAQIGENTYETLAEAVAEAKDGEVIKLIADHGIDTNNRTYTDNGYAFIVVENKGITIDLAGNDLIAENDNAGYIDGVFGIMKGGKLTITDSSADKTGTVQMGAGWALIVNYGALGTDLETTLTINGGNYKLGTASNSLIFAYKDGPITVNGGTFELGNVDTGENGSPWIFNVSGQNVHAVTINGGTYNDDVSNQYWRFEAQLGAGKAMQKNDDGTWTVVDAAANVTYKTWVYPDYDWREQTIGYATLEEAIAAAKEAFDIYEDTNIDGETVTVTLLDDATINESLNIDWNITLNKGEYDIKIADGAKVTLKAGTYSWNVTDLCAEGYKAVANENGTYTVKEIAVAAIGDETYPSLTKAIDAAKSGDTITLLKDIVLSESLVLNKEGNITIDGAGFSIKQAEGYKDTQNALVMLGASTYGDEEAATHNYTFKDVIFDGIEGWSVIRSQGVDLTMDGCTIQNCEQVNGQSLLRLDYTEANIVNTVIKDNTALMAITHNFNGNSSQTKLNVEECVIENNTFNKTAGIYYVVGGGCTIDKSEFVGNTVNCSNNGAVIYLGFQEDCAVTGCLFKYNEVKDSSTSTRVAGAIFFGYEADISGNAFVNNSARNANGDNDIAQDVCTSTYYNCAIDLSENYWDGNKPVENTDYFIQHKTGDATFAIDSYYTEYTLDEKGNVVLSNKVDIDYVAYNVEQAKRYDDLTDALDAAAAGETVQMLKDYTEDVTVVSKGVTLDLNGCTLTTEYLASFGDVVDNSGANTGKLVGSKTNIMLQTTNTQLPVKVDGGYAFYTVSKINSAQPTNAEYQFVPYIEPSAHALLKGDSDTGVTINVEVTWSQELGTRTQNFVYNKGFVNTFLNSYNAQSGKYGQAFIITLNNASELNSVTYDAVVRSDLGVTFKRTDFI